MSADTSWEKAIQLVRPKVALILGSGLNTVARQVEDPIEFSFDQVPDLPRSTVAGHQNRVILGQWPPAKPLSEGEGKAQRRKGKKPLSEGLPVRAIRSRGKANRQIMQKAQRRERVPLLVFLGRLHLYEGFQLNQITRPVHLAKEAGAEILLVTNSAGGIRDDLAPGRFMVIDRHVYWRTPREAVQENTRSSPYSDRLIQILLKMTGEVPELADQPGVYGNVIGPNYETRAEIRAMREMGFDTVGMSTAQEIEAGAALGMECAGISCVTNWATGLESTAHHHENVLSVAGSIAIRLARMIDLFLRHIGII